MRFFLLVRTLLVWALLAGAAVFFAHRTYEIWFADQPGEGGTGPAATSQQGRRPPPPRIPRAAAYRRTAPYGEYDSIAQGNLFSSDRAEQAQGETGVPLPAMPSRPLDSRFALFGIVAEGDRRKALVANLDKTSPSERDDVWVRAGDVVGGMTVVAIDDAKIILFDGSGQHVVRLSEWDVSTQPGSVRRVRTRDGVQTIEVRKPEGTPPGRPEAGRPPAGATPK